MGFLDLHIHILPGIDDGACDWNESLEMAAAAVENGVRMIAATSHGNLSAQKEGTDGKSFAERYLNTLEQFRSALRKEKIPLQVCPGMEVMAGRYLPEKLRKGELLTLNGTGYVLVEVPFRTPGSRISRILLELQENGYQPVLAHPERYDCVKSDPGLPRLWKERQVLLQINKGSLLGEFGKGSWQAADWMMMRGLADLVATDAHDTALRTVELEELLDRMEFQYGPDSIEVLLKENPARVLEGKQCNRKFLSF